ncbi:protein AAR2 homolog [Macadamia integrifolia]|uniref:protein AAR2 homolog n=1 Tax=Macadamia integrifolia TaxID=60698 RepID=UPI001C4F529E|nr:protein AAR2 homolog [Macadamia integrifolia]
MFSVGPVFKGIKMIPPGPHFVYYSSSNRDGNEFSPVVGFFIDACSSGVIVRKWHQQEERLVKLSDDEEERYSAAVKKLEFDHQLGPYDLNRYGDWKRISNYITKDTIRRIEPIGGEITVVSEAGVVDKGPKTAAEKALAEQLQKSKFSIPAEKPLKQRCYYTSIPRFVKNKSISGQELTSLNHDKTQLLEAILAKDCEGSEDLIIGELQFAFIAFLMGQSLEAFLQWKALVSLFFSCIEAVSIDIFPLLPFYQKPIQFYFFIKVLYYQLHYGLQKDRSNTIEAEKGATVLLDESWLSTESFLHRFCKDFFSLVLEASVIDGDLLTWTRKLKELLEGTLGWEFHQSSAVDGIYAEEDDEFAPVVEILDDASFGEATAS